MDDRFPVRHYIHIIIYAYVCMLIMYMCEYIHICVYAHICMHILYICMQKIFHTHFSYLFLAFSHAKYLDANKKNYHLLALGTTVD